MKGSPFADNAADAIANDGDHVAIVGDVGLITQSAASGDDYSAALLILSGNGDIQNAVQALDDAGDAAALLWIEPRIGGHIEDASGADDVRASEENDRVAVCVRPRDMEKLHGLSIDEQRPFLCVVGVSGPGVRRNLRVRHPV